MDKEALVKSDFEVEGLVLGALSRARIPITLFDWNYLPQLEEWELVMATPWFDTKGPHEANSRVLEALSQAGVYQKVPIRRLHVLSPSDPIVQALERKVRAKTEGAIHIIQENQNPPTHEERYSIIFAPFTGRGGAVPAKRVIGNEQLRQFLGVQVGISPASVENALAELDRKNRASIFHVQLTNREAKKLGLA